MREGERRESEDSNTIGERQRGIKQTNKIVTKRTTSIEGQRKESNTVVTRRRNSIVKGLIHVDVLRTAT